MADVTWDIARRPFPCCRCDGTIGHGEAFRVSRIPNRIGMCEGCSNAVDGTAVPAHIRPRGFLEQLRDDINQARSSVLSAPRSGFAQFNRATVGATLRGTILAARQKATPQSVRAGRQPSCDPRGQNFDRYGVRDAIRRTSQTDWTSRRLGERDE